MANKCKFCGKQAVTGNNVSHANNKTKRRWLPNLKRIRIQVGKTVKTVRLCTRCIRTGKFQKAA